jgi:pilin isopeptide linkage protein/LPXTG-motif cell wall-anchored protein
LGPFLTDAEFTLYDGRTVVRTYKAGDVISSEDLIFSLGNAKEKKFTLKETKAPAGYQLDATEHVITLTKSVTSDWSGSGDERKFVTTTTYKLNGKTSDTLTVLDKRITGTATNDAEIRIEKKDEVNNEDLTGAEFTLYDGRTVVRTYKAGDVISSKVLAGRLGENESTKTFTLKETKAPAGYQLDSTEHAITLTKSVTSDWSGSGDDRKFVATTTYKLNGKTSDTLTVLDKRITGTATNDAEIRIEKKDEVDNKDLTGAEFTLYDGKTVVRSYKAGDVISSKVLAGRLGENESTKTFTLKETKAPAGYQLDSTEHTVTLTKDVKSDWSGSDDERKFVTTTTYRLNNKTSDTLTVLDKRITDNAKNDAALTIQKSDAADGKALSGAVFTLFEGSDAVKTYTTDDDGRAVISSSDLLESLGTSSSKTYILKETTAPDGYRVDPAEHPITLTKDVTSDWSGTGEDRKFVTTTTCLLNGAASGTITVSDERETGAVSIPAALTIEKHDARTGKVLSGAEFTLFDGSDAVKTYTTGENGQAILRSSDLLESLGTLSSKTYTLKETKAPAGYELDPAEHTITLTKDVSGDWSGSGADRKYITTTTYTLSGGEDGVIAVSDKPQTISIPVEKRWADGAKGSHADVELVADGMATGKILTLTDGNGWKGSFSDLVRYDSADGHEIVYTVRENTNDFNYTVTGDGKGGYIITNSPKPEKPVPAQKAGSLTLTGTKALIGGKLTAGEFSFRAVDENGRVAATGTNDANGNITFSTIWYGSSDIGTHTYTVSEVPGNVPGVIYDSTTYRVRVTVSDNGKDALSVTADQTTGFAFTNRYQVEGTAVVEARKVLNNRALTDGEFTFRMVSEDGTTAAEAVNDADGRISLELPYTRYDIGEHTYQVYEVRGSDDHIIYDSTVYTIRIRIYDNGDGTLKAEVLDDDNLVFTNTYDENGGHNEDHPDNDDHDQPGHESSTGSDTPTFSDEEEDNTSNQRFEDDGSDNQDEIGTDSMSETGTPKTGDDSDLPLYLILMLLSASVLTGSVVYRKKRKNGSR